ncbi:replication-relaxation family protein [Sulfitobacter sp. M22298]|uniref:replication-relaxation family protein n=1 Tax=Sulfitobacter sp. M22298 TaxID=3368575 RepID=UPI0037464C48
MAKPTGKPRVTGYHIITSEMLETLELLARYKYLRSSFIEQLLGVDKRAMNYRLQLRREQGYVYKPKEQRRGYNSLHSPRIHAITKKGEQVLIDHDRHPLRVTQLDRKPSYWPARNFTHSMMICDVLASIEIGLKGTGCRLIPWTEIIERATVDDPVRLPFSFTYEGRNVTGKLVPDGLFGIQYPDGKASFFALETEHGQPLTRSHFNSGSTKKKLLAYKAIIDAKTYQQTGAPNLRVLFVAPTRVRSENMAALAVDLFNTTTNFLFHDVPVQEILLDAPPPFPNLVTSHWMRAGYDAIPLYSEVSDVPKTQKPTQARQVD